MHRHEPGGPVVQVGVVLCADMHDLDPAFAAQIHQGPDVAFKLRELAGEIGCPEITLNVNQQQCNFFTGSVGHRC